MRFIENTLLKDEKIVFATRPHWVVFLNPALILCLIFVLQWDGVRAIGNVHIYDHSLQFWLTAGVFLAAVVAALNALMVRKTSEYGITNKRILMKTGLIQRQTSELFLDKVEAIYVDQSILGRILNYGVLNIVGTGGSRDPFYCVPDPLHFRKVAQQQIDLFAEG